MNKRIAAWLPVLVFLVCSPALFAQGTAQSSATPPATDSEKNVDEYINLLRGDVRHQKAEIMGAMMELSAADAAKFWPIYNEYDVELAKLNDMRVANIKDYAQNYDSMTDAKADELVRKALDYRKQRAELLATYYGRVKTALGSIQAARFLQVEDQLLLLIDLQIASQLPIAVKGS